ncbi:hypothetical protein [Polyangium sp. 6x1]|uniref:hypothetical protein n=1 Tax=Polyangium sp. 6x1 TaxID=3042689 RepID=UPI002482C937|nr:hypothetical protein [Polyangium sp. 6x1]MDI1442712.1 hypothetical protein [Polyangium sp. 6x1]
MTFQRSLLVAASIGAGLLQAACLAGSDEVNALDPVGLERMSGGGGDTQGGNGLQSESFIIAMDDLWDSTSAAFDGNNAAVQVMEQSQMGRDTLKYAARIALPTGPHPGDNFLWLGQGMLTNTSGWPTGALATSQQKYDLFAVMLAHLNPFGAEEDILLAGANLASQNISLPIKSLFTFNEALWVAYENANGLQLEVWPLDNLSNTCVQKTAAAAKTRTCGRFARTSDCPVTVRTGYQTHCTYDAVTETWTSCEGHPAIQTWLKADGWKTLYPSCLPEPQ